MLTDVLTAAQRLVAYKVYKWLTFGLGVAGLLTTVVADPGYAKAVALGLSIASFVGTAIGATAQANTPVEAGPEYSDGAPGDEGEG